MTAIVWDDLEGQVQYLRKVTDNFLNEFLADKTSRLDLDKKYRQLSPDITDRLKNDVVNQDIYGDIGRKFIFFLENWQALANRISLTHRLAGLLSDVIHMQINRLFSADQRKQELLVYYCLSKHTQSKLARVRKQITACDIESN